MRPFRGLRTPLPPVGIDLVAILDSVPVGTPQIAGVPESLHFWLQRTRMSPPQEIYAVTGGCAREKICQKMQNDDNGHGGGLPATIRRANLDGPGVAEQNLGRYCRLTRQIRRRSPCGYAYAGRSRRAHVTANHTLHLPSRKSITQDRWNAL